MYEPLRTKVAEAVGAAAHEYHQDYRVAPSEAILYALGAAQVVIADLVRETMAGAAEGGDSAARLSAAYAAGQEITLKSRDISEAVAEFAVVRPRVIDPLGAAAQFSAALDQLTAQARDKNYDLDPSDDDDESEDDES